jgi:hypothetical protein
VIAYPRPRINRMVDHAIGCGEILVEYERADRPHPHNVTVLAAGTIPPEYQVAAEAASVIRKTGVNPVRVRVLWARGTWQEIPQWTGQWFTISE